jgi:hypothetical protein
MRRKMIGVAFVALLATWGFCWAFGSTPTSAYCPPSPDPWGDFWLQVSG